MWLSRTAATTLVFACLSATSAWAADPIAEQRKQIHSVEARITDLQMKLGRLLAEMTEIENQYAAASGRLGVFRLRVKDAQGQAKVAQVAFNRRASEAYKRRFIPQAVILLGVKTFPQAMGATRFLAGAMQSDLDAYRSLVDAQENLGVEQQALAEEKRLLTDSNARLEQIREEIRVALDSEQKILESAQAELSRLEARRRAELEAQRKAVSRGVSPAVEARRRIRQEELDRRLAALLDWYAPGTGSEPFMPEKLRATGIVTSGMTSWYGPGFDGRRASSGATYHQNQLTAASLVLPFGTLLKVTYGARAVVVVITDRGPYIPGRVLDLSAGAAQAIGVSGVRSVRMEIVVPNEPAPRFP